MSADRYSGGRSMTRRGLLVVGILAALMVYALAGAAGATFHGDEAMHLYSSRDYSTAIVEGNAWSLTTQPPYAIDSDPHLRILNGSLNRYTIGLARQLAGQDLDALPPRPGWDWGLSYADNVASGHRPMPDALAVSRLPSTLFFVLSIPIFCALAHLILRDLRPRDGEPAGIAFPLVATAIYALHPVLLLNARRAGQEGAVLCFGLLTLLIAAHIARARARQLPTPLLAWIALTVAAALTLVSKHSGAVFVLSAFAWVAVGEGIALRARAPSARRSRVTALARMAVRLAACGLAAGGLFIALSPALWNDPAARLGDLLTVRAELLRIQAFAQPNGGMNLGERAAMIGTQTFLAPPAHFEVASWGDDLVIQAEVAAYMASPLSGVQPGIIGGGLLTLAALFGIGSAVWRLFRPVPPAGRAAMAGLLLWLVLTAASLMTNPLPWQRYYLPLMPIAALGVALGLHSLMAWRQRSGTRISDTMIERSISGD